MKKVAFLNAKGGVGKSTISMLVSCAVASTGKNVGLVDYDVNQKTLTKTFNVLKSNNKLPETLTLYNPDTNQDYALVVFDTPGRLDAVETQDAIAAADHIFLVTSPSLADIFTAKDTVEKLKKAGHADKCRILYNKIRKGTQGAKPEHLKQAQAHIDLPSINKVLYLRSSFENFSLTGWDALHRDHKLELHEVMTEMFIG